MMNRATLLSLLATAALAASTAQADEPTESRGSGIRVRTGTTGGTSVGVDDEGGDRIEVNIGGSKDDDLDLSPETMARLSDAQLFDLLKAKQERASDPPVEILVPIGFFAMIVGVTAIVVIFRNRRERLRHETIRLSIERGYPITPELLVPGHVSPLRRGLILLGVGLGLSIMLWGTADESGAWAVGMLPAMIGGAYLLIWWLEQRKLSDPSYPVFPPRTADDADDDIL